MEVKKISVFEAITFAFRAAIEHIRLFVLVLLVGTILIATVVAIATIFNRELIQDMHAMLPQLQELQRCIGPACIITVAYQPQLLKLLLKHIITIVIAGLFLGLIISSYDLGFKKVALDVYDKKPSMMLVVFSYFNLAPKIFIGWILYFGMVIGGWLLIVPGIIFLLRFTFFPYFIVDRGAGVIDSLRLSWQMTKGYTWDLLVLWIFMKIIVYLGSMIWVGFLITWPVSVLSYAYIYRKLSATTAV